MLLVSFGTWHDSLLRDSHQDTNEKYIRLWRLCAQSSGPCGHFCSFYGLPWPPQHGRSDQSCPELTGVACRLSEYCRPQKCPIVLRKVNQTPNKNDVFEVSGNFPVIGNRLAVRSCKRRPSEKTARRNRKSWPASRR